MSRALFRFYAGLNDFLPFGRRQVLFAHTFEGRVSIKDMIESLGVPHTEIDLILVNDEPQNFSYLVQNGDQISVYPPCQSPDIRPLGSLQPPQTGELRFVLDVHLGRLAAYLRTLGFDTLYPDNHEDKVLAAISQAEKRTLLTRDRGLLKRKIVTHGYYVRATNPREQIGEVLRRFDLFDQIAPFRRCVHCNAVLQPVSKEEIRDRLEPDTCQYYDEFHLCPSCQRIYWKGTHYQRMLHFIDQVRAMADPSEE